MSLCIEACERNKDHILDYLKQELKEDSSGFALEIASGTGQHITHFASCFTKWMWQPSDIDVKFKKSIIEYTKTLHVQNVLPPLHIDITKDFANWEDCSLKENSIDLVYNANMVHISPISCTEGLFKTAGVLLKRGGKLITYGPYSINGVLAPSSNVKFDKHLKSLNPAWGIRDTSWLSELASANSLTLTKMVGMPSNNNCLLFEKS